MSRVGSTASVIVAAWAREESEVTEEDLEEGNVEKLAALQRSVMIA
jgi:hypothetical protein